MEYRYFLIGMVWLFMATPGHVVYFFAPIRAQIESFMNQNTSNKLVVRDFYRRAIGQGDIAFAEQIIADTYIQHSPMVKAGKSGLMESLAYLKKMPRPANPTKPFMRLIAEGDYVVTNTSFSLGGKQKAVVDIFRFQAGQIVEHWDAILDQPEVSLNGNAMMDGDEEVTAGDSDKANKQLVAELYEQVFIGWKLDQLNRYVSSALRQHNPAIADGIAGLQNYLISDREVSYEKVHRVIGEGNFVVVQAEGKWHSQPAVFYDIFRVDNGKVVEQWSVYQAIPAQMPHGNGMI